MKRRQFLKVSAMAATLAGGSRSLANTSISVSVRSDPSALDLNAAGHQQRLRNLGECDRRLRRFLNKRMVIDYLPGQVVYNLGEYPARKPWAIDDWDEQQLAEYSRAGIQLVQVHEPWNDAQRLFGADKFTPVNDRGFRKFVGLCHRYRLKIIPYISTGYFQETDPDFKPEWARSVAASLWYRYARCLPESPGWRAYLLPKLRHILDEYGVDGFYNDVGYSGGGPARSSEDEGVVAASSGHAAFEDLLGIVYDEVKRRGGITKIHAGLWYRGAGKPPVDPRLYDYLWVGESDTDPDVQREAIKNHPPYLVPCIDVARTRVDREDDHYLHAIPYLQFPVLLAGRPYTGERMFVPGIRYEPEPKNPDTWTRARHIKKMWDFYQKNPQGPFSYGSWDSVPGRPEARPAYYRWLKLYRTMVEPGTWAFIEVTESDLFTAPLPANLTVSVFANRDLYVALANYSRETRTVETTDAYESCVDEALSVGRRWVLPPRSLVVLKRSIRASV